MVTPIGILLLKPGMRFAQKILMAMIGAIPSY